MIYIIFLHYLLSFYIRLYLYLFVFNLILFLFFSPSCLSDKSLEDFFEEFILLGTIVDDKFDKFKFNLFFFDDEKDFKF